MPEEEARQLSPEQAMSLLANYFNKNIGQAQSLPQLSPEQAMSALGTYLNKNMLPIQRVNTFPEGTSMPQRHTIANFTGGLNTDKSIRHLSQEELMVANNVDYSERGGVQKRPSFETIKTIAGQDIQWTFEWNMSDGSSELIAVLANGDMIKISDDTTIGNTSFVASGFDYEVYQEYLYLLDGNNYYRIDDDVFNMIEVQPLDTSYYEYFAEEFQEVAVGDYNLEFDELKVDSETVQDSFGEKGEYTKGTDYTMDYDNGVLTILDTDIVGDTIYIEYEYYIESDVDLSNVKKCTFLTRHLKSNRFFATGNPSDPSALYYSEPLEPNNFKGHNVVYPATNDGPVQALGVLDDMLLVFFKNSVWAWRGINPQIDAVWEKLPLKHGTYNRRTLEYTMNTFTFLDLDGIYSLSSLKEANNITDNKITEIIKGIGNKNNIVAKFDASQSKYFLAYSETPGTCDKLLMGDWSLGAYSVWDNLSIEDMEYTLDGELYIAQGETIKKLSDNWTEAANMSVKTGEIILGDPYTEKHIEKIYISLSNYTADTSLKIHLKSHWDDNTGGPADTTLEFDISSNTERITIRKNAVAVQIEVEDSSSENVLIYDISIDYRFAMTYRGDKR